MLGQPWLYRPLPPKPGCFGTHTHTFALQHRVLIWAGNTAGGELVWFGWCFCTVTAQPGLGPWAGLQVSGRGAQCIMEARQDGKGKR